MPIKMITLTLAHPLNAKQAERLHAEAKDYGTGDKITIPADDARAIINGGFAAGIDPENPQQVQEALNPPTGKAKSSGTPN